MKPEDIQQRVLHRDSRIIVLDKPAGLAVHGGPGTLEHLELFLPDLRFGLSELPRLAHRLDRDTSGCLVLARNQRAASRLGRLFEAGRVRKTYWAVVHGGPTDDSGTIDLPLFKQTGPKGWKMTVDRNRGQDAVTEWRVLGRSGSETWLELSPRTGRTHQIRIHCAAMGFPLVGDPVYGPSRTPDRHLHLHARAVEIPLWEDREPVRVEAPVPAHMREALSRCGLPA